METILYLIRHAQTAWNVERRIQGHSDSNVNDVGRTQALTLARHYADQTFASIYASDLKRAYDTAKRLAEVTGNTVKTMEHLRERCYGQLEGFTQAEIREHFGEIALDDSSYGVESFHAMQKRAYDMLTHLAASHVGETIGVVTHGGFINAFLHDITDAQMGPGITRIDNTSVTRLRYIAGQWEVLSVNCVKHLYIDPLHGS